MRRKQLSRIINFHQCISLESSQLLGLQVLTSRMTLYRNERILRTF